MSGRRATNSPRCPAANGVRAAPPPGRTASWLIGTPSWLIGLARRGQVRDRTGELPLASEVAYAAEGYSFVLDVPGR